MKDFNSQIILGIDPGTHRMGWGIIQAEKRKAKYLDCGVVEERKDTKPEQLLAVYKGLSALVEKYRPEMIGIEKLFFMKNQTTAMAVAEARGVVLLLAAENNIPVVEVAPTEVKQCVTGYGQADKKAVTKMVKLILGTNELKVLDDATDALAIAISAMILK